MIYQFSLIKIIAIFCVSFASLNAWCQFAPTKPVRLIIPSSPGGGTDAIGRFLAEGLSTVLKQQVIPENKAGASGVVGSEILSRSAPDGLTLMIVQTGHSMNPALFKKLPYDTFKDFTPIISLARSPLVLISSSGTGVKSFKELVERGKRDPKTLNFAAAEASTQLAIVMLGNATRLPVNIAAYKGTGPAVMDVAGGHIDYTVTTIASTLSQKSTGKINYLAVLTPQRTGLLPEVPSISEQGVSDVESIGWWGVLGPPNMPKALVQDLNRMIRQVMETPDAQKKLQILATEPWMGTPESFDDYIRKEVASTLKLAKQAGITPE